MKAVSFSLKESNCEVSIYSDLSFTKENEEESSAQYKTQLSLYISSNHLEVPIVSMEGLRNREAEEATGTFWFNSSISLVLPCNIN